MIPAVNTAIPANIFANVLGRRLQYTATESTKLSTVLRLLGRSSPKGSTLEFLFGGSGHISSFAG
jgi:hypothetical protein